MVNFLNSGNEGKVFLKLFVWNMIIHSVSKSFNMKVRCKLAYPNSKHKRCMISPTSTKESNKMTGFLIKRNSDDGD